MLQHRYQSDEIYDSESEDWRPRARDHSLDESVPPILESQDHHSGPELYRDRSSVDSFHARRRSSPSDYETARTQKRSTGYSRPRSRELEVDSSLVESMNDLNFSPAGLQGRYADTHAERGVYTDTGRSNEYHGGNMRDVYGGSGRGGGGGGGGGGGAHMDHRDHSDRDSDSENEIAFHWSQGTREFPDAPLLNPGKRVRQLELLEHSIINNSALAHHLDTKFVLDVTDSYQLLQDDANVIEQVIWNFITLQQQNFCGATTNVLVVDGDRTSVATLRVIDLHSISQLHEKYMKLLQSTSAWNRPNRDALLSKCYGILDEVGIAWPSMRSGAPTESLIYASRAVSRFLDLAMISYCGAHFEAFDETYLDEEVQQFSIRCDTSGSWITMNRRPFRCLGPHFRHRSAWVFQSFNHDTELSFSPLYLSTTLEQFTDIFGPVWKTMHHADSTRVMKYNVGIGYIIAWRRGYDDPQVATNEVFCHWTDNVNDLDRNLVLIPQSARLLIGGTPCLSTKKDCRTEEIVYTNEMKSAGRYQAINVRLPQMYRDSVTVQAGFSHFVNSGVQVQYKMREGSSIKDRFIAAWTSEPEGRSIEIIRNNWAVAVSACTTNTKRITIFELLKSSTMRYYLDRYDEGIDADDLRRFHAALNTISVERFIKIYKLPTNRKPFGTLVSRCFEALKHTGVDDKLCLRALWAPKDKTPCVIDYGHKEHGWTGILVDSRETCTIAIVTEDCLEIQGGEPSCQQDLKADKPRYSVLETAIVINRQAPSLKRNENYHLGHIGELRPYASIDADTIVAGWSNSKTSRVKKKVFRRALLAHREFIHWDDHEEHIVFVLVASHRSKKMRVVVVRNGRWIVAQMGMIMHHEEVVSGA